MIDAKNAVFAECLCEIGFDLAARSEIVADRFFHGDAGTAMRQACSLQMLRDGPEVIRRNGKIEEYIAGTVQRFGQRSIGLRRGGVALAIMHACCQARPSVFREILSRLFHNLFAHHADKVGVAVPGRRKADDRHSFRQMSFLIEKIQGGKQHFLRQIACRSENHNRLFVVRHRPIRSGSNRA